MAPSLPAAVSLGRRRRGAAAKGAVVAFVLACRDKLEGNALRLRGTSVWARHIEPHHLAAEWRAAAEAKRLPKPDELAYLFAATLSGWGSTSLSDKVLMLDAWGFMQARHPAFALPRVLLRRVAEALWAEPCQQASLFELNLAAARAADFLSTPGVDQARSALDAVIHACADRVRGDPKEAAHMGTVISLGHLASRKSGVQGELVLLRAAAAASANPLEQAIQERVGIAKLFLGCDSFAARTSVAAALARDALEHGGDVRESFIKMFGHAPESHAEEPAEEAALEAWRRSTTHRLAKESHAEQRVQPSGASVITVHSDGRAVALDAPQAAVLAAAAEQAAEEAAEQAAEEAAEEAAEGAAAGEEHTPEASPGEDLEDGTPPTQRKLFFIQ